MSRWPQLRVTGDMHPHNPPTPLSPLPSAGTVFEAMMVSFLARQRWRCPLLAVAGQGQVMRARQRGGPPGMACALGIPGVQGSSAVTLNQNRHLPFERAKGRRTAGQINTKVGSGGVLCVCVCEAQESTLSHLSPP